MPWALDFDKFKTRRELREAQGEWVEALLLAILADANERLVKMGDEVVAILATFLASLDLEEDMGVDEKGKPKGLGTHSYQGAYARNRVGVTHMQEALTKMFKRADDAYADMQEMVIGRFADAIGDFYALMCFELQRSNGHWEPVAKMGEAQLKRMANEKWFDGQRFSDRLWADKLALERALRRTLGQTINLGWTLRQATKAFSALINQAQHVVERLIRTEMNRVQNEALIAAYKENGVSKYEYVAILDERTSEICEYLDGRQFYVDEAEPGVNLPPMHPNCRSSTIPITPGTQKVDKDMEKLDYSQWAKFFLGD